MQPISQSVSSVAQLCPTFCDPNLWLGFPDSSAGKESACNAGDPSLIPGLGRSSGEGVGYPLQDSWASLVTQLVKHPPAMRETWVQPLGWEPCKLWSAPDWFLLSR